MLTMGIETSCDETAAAVVEDGRVLSSEVSSSVHLHAEYGGVVPEIASRFHVEYIRPVVAKALEDADRKAEEISLIAVTKGPGLSGSLLVGLSFAKAMGLAGGIPVVEVDHLKAHILSAFIKDEKVPDARSKFPFLGLVISGGHTSLYHCRGTGDFELMGETLDDAVGEAFDKVSKMMALGYPGGPAVEKMAARYEGTKGVVFPRAYIKNSGGIDFSFSGLKTAVMQCWQRMAHTGRVEEEICFSFQKAVFDAVIKNVDAALDAISVDRLAVGGGVVNNEVLRKRLMDLASAKGVELYLPDRKYCADNAAMVAVLGEMLYRDQ